MYNEKIDAFVIDKATTDVDIQVYVDKSEIDAISAT